MTVPTSSGETTPSFVPIRSTVRVRIWLRRRRQAEPAPASLCHRWVFRRGIAHDGNAFIEAGGRHAAQLQDGHQDLSAVRLVRLLPRGLNALVRLGFIQRGE